MKNSFIKGSLLAGLLIPVTLWAQAPVSPLQRERLLNLSRELRERHQAEKSRAERDFRQKGEPTRIEKLDGQIIELQGYDPAGLPYYYATDNANVARTSGTNRLYQGGGLGLNLSGQGLEAHVWDGGATRITHQEFQGRAVQADGATSLSQHATHVGGTVAAGGVQAAARGMAYRANLRAYDWNNDGGEMAVAGSQGALVTNHSYGTIAGWNQNGATWRWYGRDQDTEDYKFGFYDSRAREWDQIAVNAPYMLISKSAGNNRNNSGPSNFASGYQVNINGTWTNSTTPRYRNNSYDCISTYANAKNILTIGAVNNVSEYTGPNSVTMSSFSSWGPTDDGRIKPDICQNGVNVYSTSSGSNTQYATLSGTSMASPGTTGTLLLLQEHYRNRNNGDFMLSSTLRGLVIHTALEAGSSEGPDYRFGWGLLNAAGAANVISNVGNKHRINEIRLVDGQTISQQVTALGSDPLVATIAWIDPAATVGPIAVDDTTPKLINDIDLRLIDNVTQQEYRPYILDPANPANAATRGDNYRDNVEKIYIANPGAGRSYTLVIRHKRNLSGGVQTVSLIVSGVAEGPVPAFTSNVRGGCPGVSVNFQDRSTGNPTNWSWSFPGATPDTSSLQNPSVVYNTPGVYPVTLTVSNSQGSNTSTFEEWIVVGVPGQLTSLPLVEGFEQFGFPNNGWSIGNSDNGITWLRISNAGFNSSNSLRINLFSYNTLGERDQVISPPVDLGTNNGRKLKLRFAYSHALANGHSGAYDSLIVYYAKACGTEKTRLWALGGSLLATAGSTSTAFNAGTNPANWVQTSVVIPETLTAGADRGQIIFESVNNSGNSIFLDAINLDDACAPLQLDRDSVQVCESANLTLETFIDEGTLTWTGPNGYQATGASVSRTGITALDAGWYYATWSRANCNSVSVDSIRVRVLQAPVAPDVANDTVCSNERVVLRPTQPGQVRWYRRNQGNFDNLATGDSLDLGQLPGDTIIYVSRFSGGCESPRVAVTITVNPALAVPIIALSNDTLRIPTASGQKYQWYQVGTPDQALPNDTLPYLVPSQAGSYYVVISQAGYCSATSASFLVTSLSEALSLRSLRLYPNPAQESVKLAWGGEAPARVELFTAKGQRIQIWDTSRESEAGSLSINLSTLPSGPYFLRVVSAGGMTEIRRLTKE